MHIMLYKYMISFLQIKALRVACSIVSRIPSNSAGVTTMGVAGPLLAFFAAFTGEDQRPDVPEALFVS